MLASTRADGGEGRGEFEIEGFMVLHHFLLTDAGEDGLDRGSIEFHFILLLGFIQSYPDQFRAAGNQALGNSFWY